MVFSLIHVVDERTRDICCVPAKSSLKQKIPFIAYRMVKGNSVLTFSIKSQHLTVLHVCFTPFTQLHVLFKIKLTVERLCVAASYMYCATQTMPPPLFLTLAITVCGQKRAALPLTSGVTHMATDTPVLMVETYFYKKLVICFRP